MTLAGKTAVVRSGANQATRMSRRCYRARWVFPVDGEPIEDGTVEIEAGRFIAVHGRREPRAIDFGNSALIPGLVNAHTHLEFSDLTAPLAPPQPFADWIRSVVRYRRQRNIDPAETIRRGLAESLSHATTLVGEIATSGWSPEAFRGPSPRAVVFRELIGLAADQIPGQLAVAQEHLRQKGDGGLFRAALSPHAPYSVHPELFHALVDLAAEKKVPLAIHLAETPAELELLRDGTGELVEMLQEFGVWADGIIPTGTRPMEYVRPLAKLDRALVVHGNYLADDEIDFLAAHPGVTLVYCPRTHAYFGHWPHPWRKLLARGAGVAIGTDGRCSNPDLSIWQELQFLHRKFPLVDRQTLLELGTIRGARALGLETQTGTITPGKSADLACIVLGGFGGTDAYEMLFQSANPVVGTMISGKWLHRTFDLPASGSP